jgi:predicted MFS family arabinose efflux permease
MPFLGILEDKKLLHVPGTVVLEEDAAQPGTILGRLKHGTGRNAHTVLIPQPSDDPNDPLNWSMAKKLTAFGVTSFGCLLYAAVISGMLNPVWYTMSLELDTPLSTLVQTNGYQALVVGVTGPIFNALARKYGKRPIFLSASVICLVANIVGSAVNSYHGLLTSRILQGFAIAPYESLIFTLISDMFFVHERGLYAAWVNFLLAGVSNLATVVTGPIGTNLGWRWM